MSMAVIGNKEMIRFKIDVRTTGIHVRVFFDNDKKLMQGFYKDLSTFEERFVPGRGKVRVLAKTFATYNSKTNTYGLHKGELYDLVEYLKGRHVRDDEIKIEIHHSHIGVDAKIILQDGIKPFDYQEPIIDFLTDSNHIYVLPLQTGKGKTKSTLLSVARRGKRTAVVMGAMHLVTWKKSIKESYKTFERLRILQGRAQVVKTIADAKANKLDVDIILISSTTMRNYLDEYEELGYSTYGCDPIDFFKILGVDFRVGDEVHENLHFNFRMDIETDCPNCLYLSATIDSNERFTEKLYQTIFPLDRRYKGLKWDSYVDVTAVAYPLKDYRDVKCTGGNGMYSHNTYEQWLREDGARVNRYFLLIMWLIRETYIKDYLPGQKLLILFSSIEMCDLAANYILEKLPQFTCSAYNGDHDEEVLYSYDIICSTIGSSGTGKDIPCLKSVIMTVALGKKEKNIQVKGRLRKLDKVYPGVTPVFTYLVCTDILKHLQYHQQKIVLFKGLVKSHKAINTVNKI